MFVVKIVTFLHDLKKKKVKEPAVFHLNNKNVSNLLTGLPKGEAGKKRTVLQRKTIFQTIVVTNKQQ